MHINSNVEAIRSAKLPVSSLQLIGRTNKGLNFLVAKFFASGGKLREWKTGFISLYATGASTHTRGDPCLVVAKLQALLLDG
jgi:hypothetical protein